MSLISDEKARNEDSLHGTVTFAYTSPYALFGGGVGENSPSGTVLTGLDWETQ